MREPVAVTRCWSRHPPSRTPSSASYRRCTAACRSSTTPVFTRRIAATGSCTRQVTTTGSRTRQVTATGSRTPQVTATGSRTHRVTAAGSFVQPVAATSLRTSEGSALLLLTRVVVCGQLVDDEDMLLVCVNAQHVGAVNLHTSRRMSHHTQQRCTLITSNKLKAFAIALRTSDL